jgi:long-chain acyl-CoA synthetase
MVDKIWLKSYPQDIPAEIDTSEYDSLKDLLERSFEKFKDLPAFTNMGHSISYGELDQMSRYFGAYLQKVAGLKKGDRVAIMSSTSSRCTRRANWSISSRTRAPARS